MSFSTSSGDQGANPGAQEECNGSDDDCDGVTDEEGAAGSSTFYIDGDGDGYGAPSYAADGSVEAGSVVEACEAPDGYAGSDAMTEEIREFVKGITAPYKRVREIKYRTSLPKTISDKIRRVELREEL